MVAAYNRIPSIPFLLSLDDVKIHYSHDERNGIWFWILFHSFTHYILYQWVNVVSNIFLYFCPKLNVSAALIIWMLSIFEGRWYLNVFVIAQGKNIKLKERFMKTACTSFKCVNKYPFVEHRHKITSNGHSLLPSMTFFVQGNVWNTILALAVF